MNRVHKVTKMSDFFQKLSMCMEKHSEKGVGDEGLGDCTIWVGAKDIYGYGKKKVTWPDGSKTVCKVHRLAFMVYYNTSNLPTVDSFGEQLDISHLCHNKLCINPLHLTIEKHSINMSRNHCWKAGVCSMAHEPACVF